MAISFNNIPTTVRTPGVYAEIDNSRALQSLAAIPRRALIIGSKHSSGSASFDELKSISRDDLSGGYFGNGSVLDRMCRTFKSNNPNTELWAVAVSEAGGAAAAGTLSFTLQAATVAASQIGQVKLMVDGVNTYVDLTAAMTADNVTSAIVEKVNANSVLPITASGNASNIVGFAAIQSGVYGNDIDVRVNYFTGQSNPAAISTLSITALGSGTTITPDLDGIWSAIDNEKYDYIVNAFNDATSLTSLETELADRFLPLVDQAAIAFTAYKGTAAQATTLGNTRNSPHNTILANDESPTCFEEWAAALGAVAAFNLNIDPARPLHFLQLKGLIPPAVADLYSRSERDTLLTDGIATFVVDAANNAQIERSITTYQTNSASIPDVSYLDVQTLATLIEIRDQFKIKMSNSFIAPRVKLADDNFPVAPGQKVATPGTVRRACIDLFGQLRDQGLIENLDDFITNIVVERDAADLNRVNVLLPPDLINQFRVLAAQIQFIL